MKRWLIAIAAMSLVVAACSDDGGSAGIASLEDTAPIQVQSDAGADAEVSEEDALLEFAACMRENGVEDFEDPDVSAEGEVQFNFRGGGEASDVDRETQREAMQTCRESIEGLAFGPGGGEFDQTEMQDNLVAFAACMRVEGIDMDDPDLSAGREGGGPFGDLDFEDADVQAAMEVCQAEFGGEMRIPGTGGGPGGGNARPAPGGDA